MILDFSSKRESQNPFKRFEIKIKILKFKFKGIWNENPKSKRISNNDVTYA